MATLNYTRRLAELQNRKFDRELQESIVSKSFGDTGIPENVRYLLESMRAIDPKYNERTKEAARRVKGHLEEKLDLHFGRDYRTQGSVMTGTNIRVHSDFDLLSIINRYMYAEVVRNPYTATNPVLDIEELRSQSTKILKGIYDEVDDTGDKCITILNKSLKRKIDVVFAYWYDSEKYVDTNDEYYRGVHLFDFPRRQREPVDYPFATIHNVKVKGETTRDGSRMGIRLLKNLKIDGEVNLNSFVLTSISHSIDNNELMYITGNELQIAQALAGQFTKIVNDPIFRKSVKSPNAMETTIADDTLLPQLRKMKEELDTLIEDASKEILNSPVIKKAMLTY
jgi:hypothetical protein